MPINWKSLDARAKDFNDTHHTSFNYSDFYSKLKTIARLEPNNAANIVYKGTLGSVLKDTMIFACNKQRSSQKEELGTVDLMDVVKNFEEYLMRPFVEECKKANEPLYPKAYGGMTRMQRIELVEHVLNASPKNDVELTERAYLKGQIRLRDIRENINDMPFAVGRGVDRHQIQRIGTFMLAIENVNKSRPLWWRIIHPFRNNAEQRDVKEMKTLLNSFGENVLKTATLLATEEYEVLKTTKESVTNAKLELENEKKAKLVDGDDARNSIKVVLDSNAKTDIESKIEVRAKDDQPVKGKNS